MTTTTTNHPVPAHSLDAALAYVRQGGTLVIASQTRPTMITAKTLAAFEKVGAWLLREDGEGYRLRTGKTSVYIMPGYLRYV